jgi:hypothetical protein
MGLRLTCFSYDRRQQPVGLAESWRFGQSFEDVSLRLGGITISQQPRQAEVDVGRIGWVQQEQAPI